MYSIKINNKEYSVKDGFIIKEEYNETLDSATIMLETINEELDIVPYDTVIILKDGVQIYRMKVDNFIYNITKFTPDINREYQINLFSETKALEKITLPDISITRSMSREKPKSVYDYIFQYCATYIPKIKVVNSDGEWEYDSMYHLDWHIEIRFEKIECPEFSWNSPTLKEVLNDLMMVDDCIVVVKNNIISFYDITKVNNDIDMNYIINAKKSMASGDYNSDLTITMKNSIGQTLMKTSEYKSLRSDSDGEVTTKNAEFITQSPIYNIKKLVVCGYTWDFNSEKYYYVELDITDYVKEKEEYEILSTRAKPANGEYKNTHQMYNLYYVRGESKISGWGETYKYITNTAQAKIYWILTARLIEMGSSLNFLYSDKVTDLRDLMIKIEYDTVSERKMEVGRYLPLKNENLKSFDNQSSSYVDVQQQSLFEYSKINRLSNDILILEGAYKDISKIPQLGDHHEDYILFSKEISLYDNVIFFKGTLTKNYILKNYFTGINAKRRSWQIASGKDALTRYDVIKYYLEFSDKKKIDIIDGLTINPRIFTACLNNDTNYKSIKHCVIYTMDENKDRFPPLDVTKDYFGEGYEMDLGVEMQGMSLCLNFGFYDNYSIDSYVYLDDDLYRNGLYSYANKHGEFNTLKARFYTYLDPADGEFEFPEPGHSTTYRDDMKQLASKARIKPLIKKVDDAYKIVDLTINNYFKDNAEIIKNTIQFECCADNSNIIVTEKFIDYQAMKTDVRPNIYIYVSQNEKYNLYSKKAVGGKLNLVRYFIKISSSGSSCKISIINRITQVEHNQECLSWGLADEEGNLLIGYNSNVFHLYMNLLIDRDDNVYNDSINQVKVGKMTQKVFNKNELPANKNIAVKLPDRNIDMNNLIKLKFNI